MLFCFGLDCFVSTIVPVRMKRSRLVKNKVSYVLVCNFSETFLRHCELCVVLFVRVRREINLFDIMIKKRNANNTYA